MSSWREVSHSYRDDRSQLYDFSWASLANFWCVKDRYLARQDENTSAFNKVIGRREEKRQAQRLRDRVTEFDRWLAGRQQESKKVFSFKEPPEARRTFGFVNPSIQVNGRTLDFDEIHSRLKKEAWPDLEDENFLDSQKILQSLLSSPSGGTS